MNTELIALAETLDAARIAANAIDAAAPQDGVYGHAERALTATLELITGTEERAAVVYQSILDGNTVTQALAWELASREPVKPVAVPRRVRLAERDADAHNRARHPATSANLITAAIAAAVRDDAGRLEYIDLRIETPLRLTTGTAAALALSIAAHELGGMDPDELGGMEADVEILRGHEGAAHLYFCTLTTEPKD